MIHLEPALEEFGRTLRLTKLRLNPKGVAAVEIDGFGLCQIEKHDAGLILMLVQELSFPEPRHWEKALLLCHPSEKHPFQPHAALRGDRQLVFSVFLSESEVTVPNLQRSLEELERLHQSVQE